MRARSFLRTPQAEVDVLAHPGISSDTSAGGVAFFPVPTGTIIPRKRLRRRFADSPFHGLAASRLRTPPYRTGLGETPSFHDTAASPFRRFAASRIHGA